MKFNILFLLAFLVILGAACPIVTVVTPTNPVIPTTPAPIPSIPATNVPGTSVPATSVPATRQATPSAIVAPQTLTNGPYLTFLRDQGNEQELVLMDANGKGEAIFPFPMGSKVIMPRSLSNLVSPDGNWLAFYTGSAGPAFGQAGPDVADLALNLMSLGITSPAGSTQVITGLLSADYPANFTQAAQGLGRADITAQDLRNAFVYGITQSIAWSPDGLHLAFAGQMNGLSTDLYLYNTTDGSIKQLSSGPEEVQWIDWSPDGKWILDGSSYTVGEGMSYNLYATSVDGQVVHHLLEESGMAGDLPWINAHEFLVYNSQNGPGNFGLVRVDVESGNVANIWVGSFNSFAVDATGKWVALQAADGLYLINLGTLQSTKVQVPDPTHNYGIFQDILSMSSEPDRAFLTRDDTLNDATLELYYLSTNGIWTPAGANADLFSVAPTHAEWIAIKDNIQLFQAGSSPTRTFNLPDGTKRGDFKDILWRPDSSGIFLVSAADQLYALDFSSGISTLVEQHLSTAGLAELIWVRK